MKKLSKKETLKKHGIWHGKSQSQAAREGWITRRINANEREKQRVIQLMKTIMEECNKRLTRD